MRAAVDLKSKEEASAKAKEDAAVKAKVDANSKAKAKLVAEAKERKKKALEAEAAVKVPTAAVTESPTDVEAVEVLEAMLTTTDVVVPSGSADQSYVKLGPTKERPAKSTRQSTLLDISLSRSMAPSLNPPAPVTSGLHAIPIAK